MSNRPVAVFTDPDVGIAHAWSAITSEEIGPSLVVSEMDEAGRYRSHRYDLSDYYFEVQVYKRHD